jgi:hypothetical protein
MKSFTAATAVVLLAAGSPSAYAQPWMPGGLFEADRVCFKNVGSHAKLQIFVGQYEFKPRGEIPDDPKDWDEHDTDLYNWHILDAQIDAQTRALRRDACSCVNLHENAKSPIRYAGMRFHGAVNKSWRDKHDTYNGGVPGFLKFAPASNKTVYLVSNGKWSYEKIQGCPSS